MGFAIREPSCAEHKAHLHRHDAGRNALQSSRRCQVQRRVRLNALGGSGRAQCRASADARGTGAAERSTTDPHHRIPTHRRPPNTAPRGDEPRPPPAGATRSTTDPNRRVPRYHQPRPTAARGDEPRPPRPAPRGARRTGFTHADHTVSAAARAIMHAMVAEHKAHLHRPSRGAMRHKSAGGVRCSAGFSSLTSAVPGLTLSAAHPLCACHQCERAEHHRSDVPCRGPPEAGTNRHPRRRAAPALIGTTRSPTDSRHRVPTHCPPRPTAPRGDEPRRPLAGTTRSPTRTVHLCGPYVQRRRTRDRAPWGCRT